MYEEATSPVAKKARIEDDVSSTDAKENSNAVEFDDDDIVIVHENISNPTTPKTPKTPGSKRKHDAEREEKQRKREAEKLALEKKKQKEKEEKEQERARQKQARLDEKLKKEDEKRQKQLEREEEAKARREQRQREEEAAKKAKEEERLKRKAEKEEEQRKAKEEKQRLAEEKKRMQEEEKKKAEEEAERKRKAQQIDKFLIRQAKPERQLIQAPSDHWLFSPFEIKKNMNVAPIHRRNSLTLEAKNNLLKIKLDKSNYLQNMPKRPVTKINKMKAKLFQFHDNNRPPYYGTWRKRSNVITGRKPFGKEDTLDYDYDSDEEWIEEEEGDECKSDEEDLEEEEMDEEDDGFFVEHGYLSSDEGESEECPHLPGESDEERKRRMKERAEEWKKEQKLKQRRNQAIRLVPNEYGPCFGVPGDNILDVIKCNLHSGIILKYID